MQSENGASRLSILRRMNILLTSRPRNGRVVALGVSILILVCIITWPAPAVRIDVARAASALGKRQHQHALEYLKHASSLDQHNAELHFQLARCYRHLGNMKSVRDHLEHAQRFGHPKKAIIREEWLAQAQSGQMREADRHLPELLQDPGNDGAQICEAYVNGYLLTTRFREAFELLDVWQAEFPKDAQPFLFRGRYLEAQNHANVAAESYRNGLKLEPWRHDLQLSLARCLIALHDHASAAEILNRLEIQTPNDPEVLKNLANCLLNQGLLPESVRFLTRLLNVQPLHVGGRLTLARVYLQQHRSQEAHNLLKQLAIERPFDTEVRYSLALTLLSAGEKERAAEEFRFVSTAREAIEKARQMMDVVSNKEPENVELRYQIGSLLLQYESPESGAGWLRSVLEIDPNHLQTHEALLEYYHRVGNKDLASLHQRHLQQSTGKQQSESNSN